MTHRGEHVVTNVRERVWLQINAEMVRQDRKWGEQNHDMIPYRPKDRPLTDPLAGLIASADTARTCCQVAAEKDGCTWAHILIEEVAEFCDAPTLDDMRAELVQVAAVAHQAIAAIDRMQADEGSVD